MVGGADSLRKLHGPMMEGGLSLEFRVTFEFRV